MYDHIMKSVIDLFEELEKTSGSIAKREILVDHCKNDLLKRVFVAAGDPYTVYYINKFKVPKALSKPVAGDDKTISAFLDVVLSKLSSREFTGNAAKEFLSMTFQLMDERQQKWAMRILLKNMRIGVQESTLNKVWPDLIKSFSVALAHTLKSEFVKGEGIKIIDRVKYPIRVEPKLDGLRCIAVKQAGKVTFHTRNGTVLETLPKIRSIIEAIEHDDVVLDGEAMGENWNESASVLMSRKEKKDDGNIFYNVFDAMALSDWINQESNTTYSERCKLASSIVSACQHVPGADARIRLVPHIIVNDESELKSYFARCMNDGYEGVMLKRTDTPYEWDRSKNILKLKPCITYEGTVVGHYDGRRGTKHEGLFGGFEVLLSNGIITRVGGGFNDSTRSQIQLEGPDSWIGRIVECEAQPDPLTSDGLTVDGKMRFPVYSRVRDKNDVDPSVTKAFKEWKRTT